MRDWTPMVNALPPGPSVAPTKCRSHSPEIVAPCRRFAAFTKAFDVEMGSGLLHLMYLVPSTNSIECFRPRPLASYDAMGTSGLARLRLPGRFSGKLNGAVLERHLLRKGPPTMDYYPPKVLAMVECPHLATILFDRPKWLNIAVDLPIVHRVGGLCAQVSCVKNSMVLTGECVCLRHGQRLRNGNPVVFIFGNAENSTQILFDRP